MAALLLISIGPVQDFIAQARRTRDLWFGSHLLSEIAKAAARALADAGAELVFPALEKGDRRLEPCHGPFDERGPAFNVGNKLLARIPDALSPGALASAARLAATQRLAGEAQRVFEIASKRDLLAADVGQDWKEQVATVLEFAAAWCPCASQDDYAAARQRVEQLLAARKAVREFSQWTHARRDVPKSSLDGARTTVLARPSATSRQRGLRLSRGEQLDAIGVIKRLGGRPEQFVPLPTVTLGPWIEAAGREARRELEALSDLCDQHDLPRVRTSIPWVRGLGFPFDAELFLEGRAKEVLDEANVPETETSQIIASVAAVHRAARDAGVRSPHPYVACLVADGDHMGRTIDALTSPDAHRRFSLELASFSSEARRIIEGEKYRGVLVYSGGDDVLAFVALADALAVAEALHDAFERVIGVALTGTSVSRPTLSVGLGIGHVLDGMGQLLALGREAERLAKHPNRDGLGVILEKRGGQRAQWRSQWSARPVGLVVKDVARVAAGVPSHGKRYEIGALLRTMPTGEPTDASDFATLLQTDVTRILARSDRGASDRRLEPGDVGLDLTGEGYVARFNAVHEWIARSALAREIWRASYGGVS